MVVLSLFLFFIRAIPNANAAVNGGLVKIASSDAVYYALDGKRYAFPNEKVFFSWYADFNSVATISDSELSSYSLVGNVTYRPGKWLVKIQTDPKVYAVSRYGILHWVTSEQIAAALYGTNWATKVQDIPDTFFTNYQIDSPILNTEDYSLQGELAITQIAQDIAGASVPPATTNSQSALEKRTFDLINQYRQSKGLSTLAWDDQIATIARVHSMNMSTGEVPFGHEGFDGRVNQLSALMTLSAAAENVAYNLGETDPVATAVDGWLHSPGHLANIENASYDKSGMGVVVSDDGSYYFTQIFINSAPVQ